MSSNVWGFFCIIVNILFWIDSTYAMCFNPQKIIDNTHFRAGCFFQGVILYCIFFFKLPCAQVVFMHIRQGSVMVWYFSQWCWRLMEL